MQPTGASKYLQLPAHDSSDVGKPSPLALLAATCQKIGAGSPATSISHRTRTPTPVLGSRLEQPMRQPSPRLAPASSRSPVPTIDKETAMPQAKIPTVHTGYELPLTPPSSPPQLDIKVSSPRTTSVPVPVSTGTERLGFIAAEHPCHRVPVQPVLHMPGLHHYSPYAMVVPPVIAQYSAPGCVNQCCCTPHLPTVHPAAVQPILLPAAPIIPTAPLSPPVSFGTYLHHEVESRMSSSGKMKSRPITKSTASLYRPYDLARHTRRPAIEEEIIDVVSV